MPDSTESGPLRFPATRHSLIEALGADDPDTRRPAYDALVAGYWTPCCRYLEAVRRFERADAEDVTQDFFTRAFLKDNLAEYDPERGRFRTFLRVCLDRFAANAVKAGRRLKRGGGQAAVPLDEPGGGGAVVAGSGDPEQFFRREWIRALFEGALEAVAADHRARGREIPLQVFLAYDVDPVDPDARPRYDDLARRFSIPVTQVTNHLAAVRRAFRKEALARLRAVTGSEADFREEARELFGVDAV